MSLLHLVDEIRRDLNGHLDTVSLAGITPLLIIAVIQNRLFRHG